MIIGVKMISVNTVDELIELIKSNRIIVYGTGYVAERFIDSLRLRGLDKFISYCAVTNKETMNYQNFEVLSLEELRKKISSEVVCIAVHESIKDTIIESLIKAGIRNYIWIYPFQHRLRFGNPCECKEVEVNRIIQKAKDKYWLAIRIAAIEQYYGKNEKGYEIYLKGQRLHCNPSTAISRLDNFKRLIKNWDEKGFCTDYKPAISYDYEILDGLHRISLAVYHRMNVIACDIYNVSDLDKYKNEYVDVKKTVIYKAGFTETEIKEIERINGALYAEY